MQKFTWNEKIILATGEDSFDFSDFEFFLGEIWNKSMFSSGLTEVFLVAAAGSFIIFIVILFW